MKKDVWTKARCPGPKDNVNNLLEAMLQPLIRGKPSCLLVTPVISTIGASAKRLGVNRRDDNSSFKMKQHDGEGGKHDEQDKAKVREDKICSGRAVSVAMESSH